MSDLSEDLAIEVIEAFDLPDGECFIFNTLKPVDALSMAIKAEEDALTFYLFLDEADRHDRVAIGAAVEELLYLFDEGALTMDETALD